MPKPENCSLKVMLIKDLLLQYTTPETKISMSEIIDYLRDQGIPAERKSIGMNIATLTIERGYDIQYDTKGSKKGYYVANPPFTYEDYRFIIDGIQSLKFIPQKKADELTNKISNLVCYEMRPSLMRTAIVSNRARSLNDTAIAGSNKIYKAITEDKKIAFKYAHFTPDRNKQKKYSKNGEKYIVSPFTLLWDKGNLYLVAYTENRKFRTFRVDRMENISILLLEPREGKDEFQKADITNQKAKVFDMYRGEAHNVKLRCLNSIGDAIIDQFGKDIMFYADGDNHFIVNLNVELSPPFFAWVATFGKKMKILGDEVALAKMKKFVEDAYTFYKNSED